MYRFKGYYRMLESKVTLEIWYCQGLGCIKDVVTEEVTLKVDDTNSIILG